MIKIYKTGEEFLDENLSFLETDKYLAKYLIFDAPLLKELSRLNYAIKIEFNDKKLVGLRTEPYNAIFFGDKELANILVTLIKDNDFEIGRFLSSEEIGDEMIKILKEKYHLEYEEALAMDFMEAREITEASCLEVEIATLGDLDEIVECKKKFIVDCNLMDEINIEKERKRINTYRLIRVDGKIASMANYNGDEEESVHIASVYTRDEYRGKGYARKVVNTLKNEIINSGKIPTLNVDKKNPISYHLYSSLGFKRVFSQGEYRIINK